MLARRDCILMTQTEKAALRKSGRPVAYRPAPGWKVAWAREIVVGIELLLIKEDK